MASSVDCWVFQACTKLAEPSGALGTGPPTAFCEHRLEAGLLPACVESCVGGARVIGDLNDANSEINHRIAAHRDEIKVLKPGMKTKPHVFYIGLPDEFVNGVDGQATVRLVAEHL